MQGRLIQNTQFGRRMPSVERRPRGVRLGALVLGAAVLALSLLPATGCSRGREPLRESREALGTIVTLTAYDDSVQASERAAADAFEAMAQVERAIDAHEPSSAVGGFNRNPFEPQPLPTEAREVLVAVTRLSVEEWFSPSLLGVVRLYEFESGGRVPEAAELKAALEAAATFGPVALRPEDDAAKSQRAFAPGVEGAGLPGLDLGGAAKGLALDNAARRMGDAGIDASLVNAGSTTVASGSKPDGEPWKVGVEDPRDPESVIAVVRAEGSLAMSTSGDYQRFFERDGVRYHHIIDPRDGRPARGLRSLTVLGEMSALDSDILSTALFVAGREQAESYAREHGLGLLTVDDAGAVSVVQPSQSRLRIELSED